MSSDIPFIRPNLPPADYLALDYQAIVESNWYTNFGPFERKFATSLGAYIGEGVYAATFSNATLALIAALYTALGRGDGTKFVLMPSFTFVAGAQALLWCGYKPLFIDIEPDSLQMSIQYARISIASGRKLAGILLCNAFGVGIPSIGLWESIAEENGLPLIIDSAAGFGSKYSKGEKLGKRGLCEIFSFHATKPFAIGEGGAVSSRNPEFISRLKHFQNFGFRDGRDAEQLGLNAKLQEINAAIGLRQLEHFDERIESRQATLQAYRAGLSRLGYQFQLNAERSSLCFASVVCRSSRQKKSVLGALHSDGVQARDYYNPPLHMQAYFKENSGAWVADNLDVTEEVAQRVISLPVHDFMDDNEIERIINIIQGVTHE